METIGDRDKALTAYLLDELPEDEIGLLEDDLLRSDSLFSRLQTLEMDLIDRYVRNEMEAEEVARFKSGFLSAPGNRDKVEEAGIFHKTLSALHDKESKTYSPFHLPALAGWFASWVPRRSAALALAISVLLIAVVVGILILTRPRNSNPDEVREKAPPATNNPRDVDPKNPQSPVVESTPAPRAPTKVAPRPESNADTQVAWIYRREMRTGSMGPGDIHILLEKTKPILKLNFELLKDAPQRSAFDVSIRDERSTPVFSKKAVKSYSIQDAGATRRVVSVDVPVSSLKNGVTYYFEIANVNPGKHFTIEKDGGSK
jgi:hypothetical protein